eukprot:7726942-Pyramimonas_sp.AAC.1
MDWYPKVYTLRAMMDWYPKIRIDLLMNTKAKQTRKGEGGEHSCAVSTVTAPLSLRASPDCSKMQHKHVVSGVLRAPLPLLAQEDP